MTGLPNGSNRAVTGMIPTEVYVMFVSVNLRFKLSSSTVFEQGGQGWLLTLVQLHVAVQIYRDSCKRAGDSGLICLLLCITFALHWKCERTFTHLLGE